MNLPILGQGPGKAQPAAKVKPVAIIFDMDGVLCHISHKTARFDWTKHEECAAIMEGNPPNWPIISLMNALYTHTGAENKANKVHFLVVTGRPEAFRRVTKAWLDRCKVKHHDIWMREDGDDRSDAEVKRAILGTLRQLYDIWFVVEDRQSVVKMWREEGILCLQSADGDY